MVGKVYSSWRRWLRLAVTAVLALTVLLPPSTLPVAAGSGDRTLVLHHTHTGLTERFTFKRNGKYDPAALRQLNVFLADWRTKEPTKMNPALFDLIWEIYQDVGATQPVNIVSAYRSPKTNAMLRARSSAVAENSQHIQGRAMDIFIPGVPLARLREAAMRHQVGGVGFYPTSGSPFVHVDTGNVRAWPRMTRAQLKKVFPDGKTLHLPTDGNPLSQTGRQYAMTQWSKCHKVPCNGATVPAFTSEPDIQVAELDPSQRNVATFEIAAPVPLMRPGFQDGIATAEAVPFGAASQDLAPLPVSKSSTLMLATRDVLPVDAEVTAAAALAALGAPLPQARLLMTPPNEQMVTAYVPAMPPDPGAQLALRMIIERETTASLPEGSAPPEPALDRPAIRTAALGGTEALDAFKGMFDLTWGAVSRAGIRNPAAAAAAEVARSHTPILALKRHETDLVAPEIDHVTETLVTPVAMSSGHFAEFYAPEGYLDDGAELGPFANRLGFESALQPLGYDHFVPGAPLLVAAR